MKHIIPLLAALALLLIPATGVHAQSGGTFQLDWFTADGGGANSPASRTSRASGARTERSAAGRAIGTPSSGRGRNGIRPGRR